MRNVIIAVVAVLVIAGGAFALSQNKDDNATTNQPAASGSKDADTESSSAQNSPAADQSASNTITYSNDGFSPSTLTIKVSSTLTVKNDSSSVLQFDSNPHPQHTDDPELNLGAISPGKSATVTVTQTGSHGYHNHLNPGDTGTLVVQ